MDLARSTPTLLRCLRGRYRTVVRAALGDAGFDDIPDHGPAVLGAIARAPASATAVADLLGLTKQAASQLIDALVVRGYAERASDPDDRRRIRVTPTARGTEVARIARRAVQELDAACAREVGTDAFAQLRTTLDLLSRKDSDGL